jgi:hypothetical protein
MHTYHVQARDCLGHFIICVGRALYWKAQFGGTYAVEFQLEALKKYYNSTRMVYGNFIFHGSLIKTLKKYN